MLLLLLTAQATSAAAPVPAAAPQSFSILADPCARTTTDDGRDVVVCAQRAPSPRLPLPDERGPPDRVPRDSGDYRDNALYAGGGVPCSASLSGCTVGFGPPVMPMIAGGVRLIKDALKDRHDAARRRDDGDRRQPIDLDTAPRGHLEP